MPEEFKHDAEPMLNRVFASLDAFGSPFAASIECRRILWGTGWQIESPILDGLVAAIRNIGEDGFYVSLGAWPDYENRNEDPRHWYVPLSDIRGYDQHGFTWENA